MRFRGIRAFPHVLVNTIRARLSAADRRRPLGLVDVYLHPERRAVNVLGENTDSPTQMSAGLTSWKLLAYDSSGVGSRYRNW